MQRKKKRKYTFRKSRIVPFESGSIIHKVEKIQKESVKEIAHALRKSRKRRKRK